MANLCAARPTSTTLDACSPLASSRSSTDERSAKTRAADRRLLNGAVRDRAEIDAVVIGVAYWAKVLAVETDANTRFFIRTVKRSRPLPIANLRLGPSCFDVRSRFHDSHFLSKNRDLDSVRQDVAKCYNAFYEPWLSINLGHSAYSIEGYTFSSSYSWGLSSHAWGRRNAEGGMLIWRSEGSGRRCY